MLAALEANYDAIDYVQPDFLEDRDIVLAIVKQCGWSLKNLSRWHNDKEVVLSALKQNKNILQFVSEELKEAFEDIPKMKDADRINTCDKSIAEIHNATSSSGSRISNNPAILFNSSSSFALMSEESKNDNCANNKQSPSSK